MRPGLPNRRMHAGCHQRGIVVFVALIAVVLMSLAAVGLMRSVHTNTMVVGNLAFRQAAQAMATSAVEKALYDMFAPTRTIADAELKSDDLTRNYLATYQFSDDQYGVPTVLQGDLSAYPGAAQVITDSASGNTARYIVERMCRPGIAAEPLLMMKHCEMIPPKQSIGKETELKKGIPLPRIPYYRMTVRVDGPGNSVAYSQAMLR